MFPRITNSIAAAEALTATAAAVAAATTTTTTSTSTTTTTSSTSSSSSTAQSIDDTINLTADADWWLNAIEEDTFNSPLPFDASEGGLWNGKFVPPPPRPPFLDESVSSDGLTTCDLCTWAWHERNAYSLDGSIGEATGELGWAFTLIIVSIISALIGAIIMVIFLRCRRLKSSNTSGQRQLPWWCRANRSNAAATTNRNNLQTKHPSDSIRDAHNNSGVWTWLSNRRASAGPDQLGPPSSSPAENHYTHMDDAYSPVGVGEALYAELDRESVRSANPSYQNTAYSQCGEVDQDVPIVSSAPSSAYYSDLSVTAMPSDRAYEVVGLTVMSSPLPNWATTAQSTLSSISHGAIVPTTTTTSLDSSLDGKSPSHINGIIATAVLPSRRPPRLAAINETTSVPSDYV